MTLFTSMQLAIAKLVLMDVLSVRMVVVLLVTRGMFITILLVLVMSVHRTANKCSSAPSAVLSAYCNNIVKFVNLDIIDCIVRILVVIVLAQVLQ